jgi:SAM-dependent methyltransferase
VSDHPPWDESYRGTPPWDIGRPQPAFARLAEAGLLSGDVLDAGCGTGEHTLLAAAHGARAVGVDVAAPAIERARAKAARRGLAARFEIGDALALESLGLTFGTVIDSGLFHVFDDGPRVQYVASLARVLRPGGTCYLMCFSDRQPGTDGPRRVSQDELRAAFGDGWVIEDIAASEFSLVPGWFPVPAAQAWLATIRRAGDAQSQSNAARDHPG